MTKQDGIATYEPVEAELVSLQEGNLDKALDGMRSIASQIRPEHISRILAIVDRIAQSRVEMGKQQLETTLQIRTMRAALENDTTRAAQAAEHLRGARDFLTRDEQAQLITAIINVTLGLAQPKK